MEGSVEARLTSIEDRLLVIERTLGLGQAPPQPRIDPPPPAALAFADELA